MEYNNQLHSNNGWIQFDDVTARYPLRIDEAPKSVSFMWPLTIAIVAEADLLNMRDVFKYVFNTHMTAMVSGTVIKMMLGKV